jgi:putative DNA primase/helicase
MNDKIPLRAPLILDPRAPYDIARKFVEQHYQRGTFKTLHYHKGRFYAWTGTHYAELDEATLRAELYEFLDGAMRPAGEVRVRFKPNRAQVNDLLDALKATVNLDQAHSSPTWLCHHTVPATEIVACRNGLLDLRSSQLVSHTPAFFNHNALDFDFIADAEQPKQWLSFLNDLWPNDGESIATVQEIFGLCLTSNTRYQKAFMLVGPPRSGKSTIARVLTGLVGQENVVGPTLTDLAAEFGMATFIGKRVACVPDARIGKGANRDKISERLLSITGDDVQNINRKYRDYWTGRLQVRFIVLSNELPEFDERSGALAGRFIVLALIHSFFGKEDLKLTDKLLMELPGILNWAIEGWRRLSARGHFVQPQSGLELLDALENLSSPIKAFVKERCVVAPNRSIECHRLHNAYLGWSASENNYCDLLSRNLFSRTLRAAVPGISVTQPRRSGKQVRVFNGIDLK